MSATEADKLEQQWVELNDQILAKYRRLTIFGKHGPQGEEIRKLEAELAELEARLAEYGVIIGPPMAG